MKALYFFIAIGLYTSTAKGQELYPNSEPASIVPKHAIGIRLMNEAYSNSQAIKSWHAAMFMYGVNSKLMFSSMLTMSNHHYKKLPNEYIKKDNREGYSVTQNAATTNSYLFESINFGLRYRFLNFDGDHKHFRMALYSNGAYAFQPHDEAEVSLMGDNKGVGGGLISTLLVHKLAISLTTGFIKPFSYKENKSNIQINYGNGYNYSLSFGYLLSPFKYKNYKQTNINLYVEFLGKSSSDLTITKSNQTIVTSENVYKNGSYIELRPAIQFIIRSNLRIDCSTAIPFINRSYIHKYPLYLLNVQYYLFRK